MTLVATRLAARCTPVETMTEEGIGMLLLRVRHARIECLEGRKEFLDTLCLALPAGTTAPAPPAICATRCGWALAPHTPFGPLRPGSAHGLSPALSPAEPSLRQPAELARRHRLASPGS
jgi:hypothetical protein